jgi:hypothetical protein
MKKKLALAFATVLAVAAVGTTVASASGPTIVDEGFPCFVFDGNGSLFITTNSVVTLYASGKVVLKCNGDGAGAPSLTYFNYGNTGVPCSIPGFGLTNDWSNKVGYNGNSQLTCTTSAQDTDGPDLASAASGSAGIAG